MLRAFTFALVCLTALPAAAQSTPRSSPEVQRASHALAAIWRPLTAAPAQDVVATACAGAAAEMSAIDAALPPVLTTESLSQVRGLHGLLIIPTEDDPGVAYFFPPSELNWFTSGLGAISVINEAEGFIAVRDAGGRDIALQIGRAGDRPILRLRAPEGGVLTYVGCAPVG